jgi:uncharacterized protein YxjI
MNISDDSEGTHTHIPDIVDEVTPEELDNYLNAEVLLDINGKRQTGKVKRRSYDANGELRGRKNANPILDTRTYEIEFPDGRVAEYAANTIASNMIAQCDIDGNQFLLMDEIVGYKKGANAVNRADEYIVKDGRSYPRRSTAGWKICIQWKDGTTTWEKLSDIKESYPVEIAEYAIAQEIDHEPAFNWWVKHFLKKRDRIVAAVNKRFLKRTHKFGIELPRDVLHAIEIDGKNQDTQWQDAIAKEMKNVRIAFKILEHDAPIPVG